MVMKRWCTPAAVAIVCLAIVPGAAITLMRREDRTPALTPSNFYSDHVGPMKWNLGLDIRPNGPQKRQSHTWVSFPPPATYDDGSAVDIYSTFSNMLFGGLVPRAVPRAIPADVPITPFTSYIAGFDLDPTVWTYILRDQSWSPIGIAREIPWLARFGHSAVPMTNFPGGDNNYTMLVFGGESYNTTTFNNYMLGDLIMVNEYGWERLTVEGNLDNTPPPMTSVGMAVVHNRYLFLVGGATLDHCSAASYLCPGAAVGYARPVGESYTLDLRAPVLRWQRLQENSGAAVRYGQIFLPLVRANGEHVLMMLGGSSTEIELNATELTFSVIDDSGVLLANVDSNGTLGPWEKHNTTVSKDITFGTPGVAFAGAAVYNNRTVVVSGGEAAASILRPQTMIFDLDTMAWTTPPYTATGREASTRAKCAGVVIGKLFVVYGGTTLLDVLNRLDTFSLPTQLFSSGQQQASPIKMMFSPMAVCGPSGTAIQYGGYDGNLAFSELWVLDGYHQPAQWFYGGSIKEIGPKFGHAMHCIDDTTYIIYGASTDSISSTIHTAKFDFERKTGDINPWIGNSDSTVTRPEARYLFASAYCPRVGTSGAIIMNGGGYIRQTAQSGVTQTFLYDDTWMFDVATETFSLLHSGGHGAPGFRNGHRAVCVDIDGHDSFILYGGLYGNGAGPFDDSQHLKPSSHVWRFDVVTRTWHQLQPAPGFPTALPLYIHLMVTPSYEDDSLPAPPEAVAHGGANFLTVDQGKFFSNALNQLQVFTFTSQYYQVNISTAAQTQLTRSGHAGFIAGDELVVFGGLGGVALLTDIPASLQLACSPGFYTTHAGNGFERDGCAKCPVGTYSAIYQAYTCTPCPPKTTTAQPGAGSRAKCNVCATDFCNGHGRCSVDTRTFDFSCACDRNFSGPTCSINTLARRVLIAFGVLIGIGIVLGMIYVFRKRLQRVESYAELQEKLLADTQGQLAELERAFDISIDEIKFYDKIDSGASGEVWRCSFGDIQVAVKRIHSGLVEMDPSLAQEFKEEIAFMRTLRHRNIVYFYGAGISADQTSFLVLEYMGRGALTGILAKNSLELPWERRLSFAADAAAGMAFLHGLNPPRIHRDLKSPNLLVNDGWTVKVGDFGTSRLMALSTGTQRETAAATDLDDAMMTTRGIGTLLWLAPELMRGEHYSLPSDVFSMAVVLWEIATRRLPWEDKRNTWTIREAVEGGERPPLPADDTPQAFVSLIEEAWAPTPDDRPTMQQLHDRLVDMTSALGQDIV